MMADDVVAGMVACVVDSPFVVAVVIGGGTDV